MSRDAYRDIIQQLMEIPSPTKRDVDHVKVKAAGKHGLGKVPSNSEIIQHLTPEESAKLLPILRRKVVRTISGVTVVAVMTEPSPCPKDEPCAYCPGGPTNGVPQSYTGHEPAALRGAQNSYNPYAQVRTRIEQLESIGHKVDLRAAIKWTLNCCRGLRLPEPTRLAHMAARGNLEAPKAKRATSRLQLQL